MSTLFIVEFSQIHVHREKGEIMSDVGLDLDAADELVKAAQDRLIQKIGQEGAKDHKLLSYLYLKFNRDRQYAWEALLKSFSRNPTQEGNVKGVNECTYALCRYLLALETELGERQPETQVEKSEFQETNFSGFNDDLPF